jgi:hypothetical protein
MPRRKEVVSGPDIEMLFSFLAFLEILHDDSFIVVSFLVGVVRRWR